MSSIKKRGIFLLACVIALAGLLLAYTFALKNPPKPADTPSDSVSLISENKASVTSLAVTSGNSSFTASPAQTDGSGNIQWALNSASGVTLDGTISFTATETSLTDKSAGKPWELKDGVPGVNPDNSALNTMASNLSSLSAAKKIADSSDPGIDLSQFGLDKPAVVAEARFADGKAYKLSLGRKTPDQSDYYAMLGGDSAVYIIDSYTAESFNGSLAGVADKNLPQIDLMTLKYFSLRQDGKPVVDLTSPYTSSNGNGNTAGGAPNELVMDYPYSGEKVYTSSIASALLGSDAMNNGQTQYSLTFNSLVEVNASDMSKYGLDSPGLILMMDDGGNQFGLAVGGRASDTAHYCQEAGSNNVYTILDSSVKNLYNMDVISLMDRVLAIYDIGTVKSVQLKAAGKSYDVVMNKTVTAPATDSAPEQDSYSPTVNGSGADEQSVKNAYQKLIALSFDNFSKSGQPTGAPAITVTFNFNDPGAPPKSESFYDYNADFYAADTGSGNYYIVSRQSVDAVLSAFEALANRG